MTQRIWLYAQFEEIYIKEIVKPDQNRGVLAVVVKKFRGGFGGFFAMLFGVLCFVRQSNQGVARFDCAQLRIVIAHALHGFNDAGCVGNFDF